MEVRTNRLHNKRNDDVLDGIDQYLSPNGAFSQPLSNSDQSNHRDRKLDEFAKSLSNHRFMWLSGFHMGFNASLRVVILLSRRHRNRLFNFFLVNKVKLLKLLIFSSLLKALEDKRNLIN